MTTYSIVDKSKPFWQLANEAKHTLGEFFALHEKDAALREFCQKNDWTGNITADALEIKDGKYYWILHPEFEDGKLISWKSKKQVNLPNTGWVVKRSIYGYPLETSVDESKAAESPANYFWRQTEDGIYCIELWSSRDWNDPGIVYAGLVPERASPSVGVFRGEEAASTGGARLPASAGLARGASMKKQSCGGRCEKSYKRGWNDAMKKVRSAMR